MKRFPIFLWGIFSKSDPSFGGLLLQSSRPLKTVYEFEGDNITAADFDYYEEVWLNYNEVCLYLFPPILTAQIRPHKPDTWHFLHVYDTGPQEDKLSELYSQHCKYTFLELSIADLTEATKKLFEVCRNFSTFGMATLLRPDGRLTF